MLVRWWLGENMIPRHPTLPHQKTKNVSSDADSRDSFDSDTSDTMSTDGDQLATSGRFPKAPDRVLDIIKD